MQERKTRRERSRILSSETFGLRCLHRAAGVSNGRRLAQPVQAGAGSVFLAGALRSSARFDPFASDGIISPQFAHGRCVPNYRLFGSASSFAEASSSGMARRPKCRVLTIASRDTMRFKQPWSLGTAPWGGNNGAKPGELPFSGYWLKIMTGGSLRPSGWWRALAGRHR
jgi:hypothetical protein